MKREHGHNTVNEKALRVFVGVVKFGSPSAVALPGARKPFIRHTFFERWCMPMP